MKIYHGGGYGRATIFCRPGTHEPPDARWAVDRWFELKTDERGEPYRKARQFEVRFQDGAAEVDDELGHYLLEYGLASAEPVTFARDPSLEVPREQWETAFPPEPRKPPMQVGQPMSPELARRLGRRSGERIRGWLKG